MRNKSKIGIIISSLKMGVATFTSRILGLVREQIIAIYFGASGVTDAFWVAYRIPNLLRDLFAEGAFSAAFVPKFQEERNISPLHATRLLWSLFIALLIVTGGISVITYLFAPEIVSVFAPSFKEIPEKFELTVNLTRIMSPFLLFVSLAALFMGALNSLRIFFIPAMAPACFNVTMILSVIGFTPFFISKNIHPIYSLGLGVLVGGLVQWIVQLPLIIKSGLKFSFPEKIFDKKVRSVFKKLGPGLVGFAATQINLLITTILATSTVVGAVSWLSYAFRLFQFPIGVLGVSIGNSNLVHFSDAWKSGEKDNAKEHLKNSYDLSIGLIMLSLSLMLALAFPTVHLIFEHGKFDFNSTVMTTRALQFYLLGLPFYGLYKIFVPTFYTLDKEKIPVLSSIGAIGFNILFCILLTPIYGFQMLALGTTISMLINVSVQGFYLKRTLNLKTSFFIDSKILKYLFASIMTFLITNSISTKFFFLNDSFPFKSLMFLLFVVIGVGTYLGVLFAMGEFRGIKSFFRSR